MCRRAFAVEDVPGSIRQNQTAASAIDHSCPLALICGSHHSPMSELLF